MIFYIDKFHSKDNFIQSQTMSFHLTSTISKIEHFRNIGESEHNLPLFSNEHIYGLHTSDEDGIYINRNNENHNQNGNGNGNGNENENSSSSIDDNYEHSDNDNIIDVDDESCSLLPLPLWSYPIFESLQSATRKWNKIQGYDLAIGNT